MTPVICSVVLMPITTHKIGLCIISQNLSVECLIFSSPISTFETSELGAFYILAPCCHSQNKHSKFMPNSNSTDLRPHLIKHASAQPHRCSSSVSGREKKRGGYKNPQHSSRIRPASHRYIWEPNALGSSIWDPL